MSNAENGHAEEDRNPGTFMMRTAAAWVCDVSLGNHENGLSAWCEFESCHIYIYMPWHLLMVNGFDFQASLVWIRGVPGLNLVFLEMAFRDDIMGLAVSSRTKGDVHQQTYRFIKQVGWDRTNSEFNNFSSKTWSVAVSVPLEQQRARCGTACDRCCQSSEGWYIFTTSIWMVFAKPNTLQIISSRFKLVQAKTHNQTSSRR